MSQELKLLPCPNPKCGKTPKKSARGQYGQIKVTCHHCNTHGPSCDNETEADAAWNSLPRPLTWTTEPPTVPGNYWWKCEHENPDAPQMVNVTITDEQFHFFFHYSEGPCLHSCGKCRWAGPIPMPQEPTT